MARYASFARDRKACRLATAAGCGMFAASTSSSRPADGRRVCCHGGSAPRSGHQDRVRRARTGQSLISVPETVFNLDVATPTMINGSNPRVSRCEDDSRMPPTRDPAAGEGADPASRTLPPPRQFVSRFRRKWRAPLGDGLTSIVNQRFIKCLVSHCAPLTYGDFVDREARRAVGSGRNIT
jgi:hypothetical protein